MFSTRRTVLPTLVMLIFGVTLSSCAASPTPEELMAELVARNMELIAHGEAGDAVPARDGGSVAAAPGRARACRVGVVLLIELALIGWLLLQ